MLAAGSTIWKRLLIDEDVNPLFSRVSGMDLASTRKKVKYTSEKGKKKESGKQSRVVVFLTRF